MTPVERARALVGTRFRPQGRSTGYGLDCLGLATIAYRVPLDRVPIGYHLRGDHGPALMDGLQRYFRPVEKAASGDLLLLEAGRGQVHLAVRTEAGFIHADARRGVVETPGDPPWRLLRAFRRRAR